MKTVAVIFGGMSTENEVSIMSGKSVIKNIDREKYNVKAVYIDKNSTWYECKLNDNGNFNIRKDISKIENIIYYLKNIDVAFPVLHGLYGEDGSIQGLFEMIQVPYVGCGIFASSVSMDKVYSKIIFEKADIKQAKYVYLKNNLNEYIMVDEHLSQIKMELNEIVDEIIKKIDFPMFVKPSNSGSSVGVNKASNKMELVKCIKEASIYDKKILIEEAIDGRELECGVLGSQDIITSCVGEIISASEFYDYDSKYNNSKSITKIPADIPENIEKQIRRIAVKAFRAVDAKGIARVDFFLDKQNNIYINEINTMPGFTNISMYPKLFEKSGVSYKDLLSKLIELAYN